MRFRILILTVALAIGLSVFCYAQDTQNGGFLKEYEPRESSEDKSSFWLRIISLLMILIFIALGIFAFKKLKDREIDNGGRSLSVLHRLPVGQKESICVVEVGDQILIVGVTSSSISLLDKVEDENTIDQLRTRGPSNLPFSSTLMSYFKKEPKQQNLSSEL